MENHYPKISIVTPSYNQGKYIEDTILSILDQNYPNLEYFIIDGGSSDETVEIIKKYEAKINFWISEPDQGQAHAINKGFKLCTGEIFNWINSDDKLAPNALFEISRLFKETNCDIVAGWVLDDFDNSMNARYVTKNTNLGINNVLKIVPDYYIYHQPGVWFRKNNMDTLPEFSADLYYHFDWDYMIRYMSMYSKITYADEILVHFRVHPKSKTISQQHNFGYEIELCYKNLFLFLKANNSLKPKAKKKFELIKWHSELQKIIKIRGRNFNAFKHIIVQMIISPRFRFTRFTFGQLKLFFKKNPKCK